MKKIVITGGCGMIGYRLANLLSEKNEVYVIDNKYSFVDRPKCKKIYYVDICDKIKINKILHYINPQIIFHLAAVHSIPVCEKNRTTAQKNNIFGTEIIFEISSSLSNLEYFILASTGAVYDHSTSKLQEFKSPIFPRDNYSLTKITNEYQASIYQNKISAKIIIARLFNVIGFDDKNAHLLPDIISQINLNKKKNIIYMGNTKPKRDYIDADDVALILSKIFTIKLKKKIDVFNICSSKEYSVREIVNKIEKILNLKIVIKIEKSRFRKVDRLSQVGSNMKLKKAMKININGIDATLKKFISQFNGKN